MGAVLGSLAGAGVSAGTAVGGMSMSMASCIACQACSCASSAACSYLCGCVSVRHLCGGCSRALVLRLSPLVPAGCEAAPPWPAARKRRYKLQQYRRRCGCMRGRAARTVCVLLTPCLQQVWQRRPNAREHHQEYLALHILCAFSHLRHRVLDIPRPGDPRLVQRHGRDLL